MARSKKFQPTRFMLPTSHYDKDRADHAVNFIQALKHTKGVWAGKPFLLFDWQEQIIRDLFGVVKPNGYRQFNTAFVEICKKAGKQLALDSSVCKHRLSAIAGKTISPVLHRSTASLREESFVVNAVSAISAR